MTGERLAQYGLALACLRDTLHQALSRVLYSLRLRELSLSSRHGPIETAICDRHYQVGQNERSAQAADEI